MLDAQTLPTPWPMPGRSWVWGPHLMYPLGHTCIFTCSPSWCCDKVAIHPPESPLGGWQIGHVAKPLPAASHLGSRGQSFPGEGLVPSVDPQGPGLLEHTAFRPGSSRAVALEAVARAYGCPSQQVQGLL